MWENKVHIKHAKKSVDSFETSEKSEELGKKKSRQN